MYPIITTNESGSYGVQDVVYSSRELDREWFCTTTFTQNVVYCRWCPLLPDICEVRDGMAIGVHPSEMTI